MEFKQITESESHYRHLEKMSVAEILSNINKEDKTVPTAIEKVIPQIEQLVHVITDKMLMGGRLRDDKVWNTDFIGFAKAHRPPA